MNCCIKGKRKLNYHHPVIPFAFSLISTLLHLIVVLCNEWDVVTYSVKTGTPCTTGFADSNVAIVWLDEPNATAGCMKTKGMVIMTESSGIWGRCKQASADSWNAVGKECNTGRTNYSQACFYYLRGNNLQCCQNMCWDPDDEEPGLTLNDAMRIVITASIVSLVLLSSSWILMLIALIGKSAMVTMMTGVTYVLACLYLALALAINHYKLSVLIGQRRLLPNGFPRDYLDYRTVSVSWGMKVGWVSVVLMVLGWLSWIRRSRYLAAHPEKTERENRWIKRAIEGAHKSMSVRVHPRGKSAVPSNTRRSSQIPMHNGHLILQDM